MSHSSLWPHSFLEGFDKNLLDIPKKWESLWTQIKGYLGSWAGLWGHRATEGMTRGWSVQDGCSEIAVRRHAPCGHPSAISSIHDLMHGVRREATQHSWERHRQQKYPLLESHTCPAYALSQVKFTTAPKAGVSLYVMYWDWQTRNYFCLGGRHQLTL